MTIFFSNNLESIARSLIEDESVCTYQQFEANIDLMTEPISHVCAFIDGLSPEEERLRWARFQTLHLMLMAFLNTFGYDFQISSNEEFKEIIDNARPGSLLQNFGNLVQRNRLSRQRDFNES